MTGDQHDIYQRIKARLPPWFGDSNTVLDAFLNGFAYAGSYAYSLYAYTVQQSRIKTATGDSLDAIALDFFGRNLQRASNQADYSLRQSIIAGLFRERATRLAITKVLQDVTGRTPIIFEPGRAMDTGGYGVMCAYDMLGGYGAMDMPFQAFVTAYRPASTGIPLVAGYNVSVGAYDTPSQSQYADQSMIQNTISDSDIMAAIDSVKPAGTIIWTQILSNPNMSVLDIGFVLDKSSLV